MVDPNRVLGEIRDVIAQYREFGESGISIGVTDELIDCFERLDGHLCGGGGLPDDWRVA